MTILNADQIKLLRGDYIKSYQFGAIKTIEKALRLQFACGRSRCEELLRHILLPSAWTVKRRLQNIKFNSGIIEEMFQFLKLRVASFKNDLDKHCMLVLDEMSIIPGEIFDTSTNTMMGYTTLGNHSNEKNRNSCVSVYVGWNIK